MESVDIHEKLFIDRIITNFFQVLFLKISKNKITTLPIIQNFLLHNIDCSLNINRIVVIGFRTPPMNSAVIIVVFTKFKSETLGKLL